MDYIELIFNEKRHGLNHIARRILEYLDYASLVQAKRSCKHIYEFILSSDVEQIVLNLKLHKDWSYGSPKVLKLPDSREATLDDVVSEQINSLMLYKDDTLFISVGNSVFSVCLNPNYTSTTSEIEENLQSGKEFRLYRNPNTNRETNILSCMDIIRDEYLLTGSRNGMLSVFNLRTCELESFKQLFGIISDIRCVDDLLATSHLGKQFDMGCITVRRFISPEEMQVVWSVYEDVMPVFSMDFNYSFLVGLEWIETLDQAQIGILSVYRSDEKDGKEIWRRTELDLNHGFTTCCIFKDEYCALGCAGVQQSRNDSDFSVVIIDLNKLNVIQVVKGHKSPIFHILVSGEHLITRDKAGFVYLWDQNLLSDEKYRDEDGNSGALIRRLSEDNEQVVCLTADLRKLVLVLKDGINCYSIKAMDFWSTKSDSITQSL